MLPNVPVLTAMARSRIGVDPGLATATDEFDDRGRGGLVDDQFPAALDVDGDRQALRCDGASGRGVFGARQRHVEHVPAGGDAAFAEVVLSV